MDSDTCRLCSWSAVDRIHMQPIYVRLLLMIHYNAVNLLFYAADAPIAKKLQICAPMNCSLQL